MKRRAGILGLCIICALAGGAGAEGAQKPAKITEGEVKAVARGSDAFGCDLYGQLKGRSANVVFSPFALSTALNMAAMGARGTAAAEMGAVLHQPATENLHLIAGHLAVGFGRSKDYTLALDSNLWLQQGYSVRAEFGEGARKLYGAGVGMVDFGDEAKARETINAAAAKSTEGRVKELVGPGVLKTSARLVLTSTVSFRGAWDSAFAKGATFDDQFYLTPEKRISVPMMHRTAELGVVQAADYTAVEIPYKGKRLAMLILVPREGKSLADVEKRLSPEHLQDLGANLAVDRVALSLPRFHVTTGGDLKNDLTRLGMKAAFESGGGLGLIEDSHPLELAAVIHSAAIDITEEGAQVPATAGTAAAVLPSPGERATRVSVDRPFVWMIVERNSRMIFFMGRVTDPGRE